MYLSLDSGRPGLVNLNDYMDAVGGPVLQADTVSMYYDRLWVDGIELPRYDDCVYYDGMVWGKLSWMDTCRGRSQNVEEQEISEILVCQNLFWDVFECMPVEVSDTDMQYAFGFLPEGYTEQEAHGWTWWKFTIDRTSSTN